MAVLINNLRRKLTLYDTQMHCKNVFLIFAIEPAVQCRIKTSITHLVRNKFENNFNQN